MLPQLILQSSARLLAGQVRPGLGDGAAGDGGEAGDGEAGDDEAGDGEAGDGEAGDGVVGDGGAAGDGAGPEVGEGPIEAYGTVYVAGPGANNLNV